MPIKAENKHRYPADWKDLRARILERARDRCEWCGVPNYAVGYRDAKGQFMPLAGNGPCDAAGEGRSWPGFQPLTYAEAAEIAEAQNCCGTGRRRYDDDGNHWIVVVLTVAHLNHVPEDCRPENLAALCNRCHLRHDTRHHAESAAATLRRKRALHQPALLEVMG